jgi:putative intracellular protease/amidase
LYLFDSKRCTAPPPTYHNPPDALIQFLKKQQPRAKYILGVCTGVSILAKAGILNGKKATTNKSEFRFIEVIILSILRAMYL